MFPKKFTFESNQVLTTRINEELIVMLLLTMNYTTMQKTQEKIYFFVSAMGFESMLI